MSISATDRTRISAALQAAEAKTSGEIVCVLAQNSCNATTLPIFIAAIVALALPWVLVAFTELAVQRILSLQIALFALLCLVLCLPPVRVALMPRATRRTLAHRAALEQ